MTALGAGFSRLKRYIDETGNCWRLGAGVPDRATLAIDTLLFVRTACQ